MLPVSAHLLVPPKEEGYGAAAAQWVSEIEVEVLEVFRGVVVGGGGFRGWHLLLAQTSSLKKLGVPIAEDMSMRSLSGVRCFRSVACVLRRWGGHGSRGPCLFSQSAAKSL